MRSKCTLFFLCQTSVLLIGPGRFEMTPWRFTRRKKFGWYRSDWTGDRFSIGRSHGHCAQLCTGWRKTTGPQSTYPDRARIPFPTLGNTLELEPSSDPFFSRRPVQYETVGRDRRERQGDLVDWKPVANKTTIGPRFVQCANVKTAPSVTVTSVDRICVRCVVVRR
jgi:hypothetical protein